jgi:Asp/Glu/hydantoin racemase
MRILLVNPNTSGEATAAFVALARAAAGPGTEIVGATGRFGAKLMRTPAEAAIGTHAALEAMAENMEGCDAVIVAAFGDYGASAGRSLLGVPVLGIADAAFAALRLAGTRFAILTVNGGVAPLIAKAAADAGLGERLTGVGFPDCAPDAAKYADAVVGAAKALMAAGGPAAILAAGPPLAPLIPHLRETIGVPIVEGVSCAVVLAEALARLDFASPAACNDPVDTSAFSGLSPKLAAALARRSR